MSDNKPSNLPNKSQWEPGQLLLGDFEVQRVLGQGGMGKVYLVRSRTTEMEFAVKHALIKDDKSRQNFLSELQTWIDLPEHPHIAACRFFRTIGDEIAIFSEYVGGGTLADWIRDRRLMTLEQILDVSIQFARGLQALHEHGLIHQDVKPSNVLMTTEAIAKMTDFGLARARSHGSDGQSHSPTRAPTGESGLVSFGGMTPAYCSPEQAAKQPLSRKTDIWSWGVSVLDMFYGEVSCRYGQTAGESLVAYFEEGITDQELPRMPVEMTMVLGKCFQPKPEHRWNSMSEAAEALMELYQKESGRAYLRQVSTPFPTKHAVSPTHDRRKAKGEEWVDPREWLTSAFQAAGRRPSGADLSVSPRTGSRRAQAIADLAVYEQAYRMFAKLIADGRKELEGQLAELCFDKALVHRGTDDLVGAVAFYERAIELYERLGNLPRLAFACGNKAITLRVSGDIAGAVQLYDRAITIYETLLSRKYNQELASHVAADYINKAVAIRELGDQRGAVALCDLAIPIYKRLVDHDGRKELANPLAMAWMNKANAFHSLGEEDDAIACYNNAIEIRERLVNQEGRREFESYLAASYFNKAMAISALGNDKDAITLSDRGILIYERLINQEGRRDLEDALGKAYTIKASSLDALGDTDGAMVVCNLIVKLYERLVNQEGRRELSKSLASAYLNQSNAVKAVGDTGAAMVLYDRAIALYERLVNQEGRQELADELAMAYMNKASVCSDIGDKKGAIALFDCAIEIRERLVNRENRRELAEDLAAAYAKKAKALFSLGEMTNAVSVDDLAFEIYESLVREKGSTKLVKKLADTSMHRALILLCAEQYQRAVIDFDLVILLREGLMKIEGECDLLGDVALAKAYRGTALANLGQVTNGLSQAREAIATVRSEIARTGRRDLEGTLDVLIDALTRAGHRISISGSE